MSLVSTELAPPTHIVQGVYHIRGVQIVDGIRDPGVARGERE